MMRQILFILGFLSFAGAAMAQGLPMNSTAGSIEIKAQGSLTWDRTGSRYIAKGGAVAKQGQATISADTLSAEYAQDQKVGKSTITRLVAEGHVIIEQQGSVASGDHATYDVEQNQAVMTGQELKMTTPDQIVTAKDRFEYHVKDGRLSAFGSVVVTQGDHVLKADQASIWFEEDPKTKTRILARAEAKGHVDIQTTSDRATGDEGTYNHKSNIVTLEKDVTLHRGPNQLSGQKATVNLTNKVSTLDAGADEKVTGVLVPGSEKMPVPKPQAKTP